MKAEIYFQLNNTYYRLTVAATSEKKAVSHLSIIKSREPWAGPDHIVGADTDIRINPEKLAKHFFYTIALNYSHYGLNSTVIGNWITTLFHKNDGYTTPLVLNPMRTDGNFDINTEVELAKQRMLLNVLRTYRSEKKEKDKRIYAADQQYISQFRFKLNWAKIDDISRTPKVTRGNLTGPPDDVNIFLDFMELSFPEMNMALFMSSEFALKAVLANYITAKIKKIAWYYPGYSGADSKNGQPRKIDRSFLEQLHRDRSHVTYKLNQAVHYFRLCMNMRPEAKLHVSKNQVSAKNAVSADFTPAQLLRWMDDPEYADISDRLPPSIFELDFELMREESPKATSYFSQLSSGEQQLIHTFQSIFYHLNNIQSAHHSGVNRVKYQTINIVFDEIELYFHPEYQRRFVYELLSAFERYRVGSADSIRFINIILLTHSPFILSDIPAENILLLKADNLGRAIPAKSEGQTFAANINDLLANGFFLKSTLMGSFAEEKIRAVIRKLKKGNQPTEVDRAIFSLIGDKFLQTNLNELLSKNHDQDQNT